MRKTLPLILVLSFYTLLISAQSFQLQENEVTGLVEAGKFEEAIVKAESFLAAAKTRLGFADTMTADYYSLAGSIYSKQGNFAAGALKFDSASLILRPALGACHGKTLNALRSAATCRTNNNRHAEAEKILLETLTYFDTHDGPCKDEQERLHLQYVLANTFLQQRKFTKAAEIYDQYIAFFAHKNTEDSLRLSLLFTNYAQLRFQEGNLPEAMNLLYKAEKIQLALPGNHSIEKAQTHNALAVVCMKLNDWSKAEAYLNRSLPVFEKMLGKSHPDYLIGLNNLANIYQKKNAYEKATEVYRVLLPATAEVVGQEAPFYSTVLGNYASCLSEIGQYETLDSILMLCQQLAEKTNGTYSLKRANFLKDLMVLGGKTNKPDKVIHYFDLAKAVFDQAVLPEHPDFVQFKYERANIYRSFKQYEQAARLHEELYPYLLKNIRLIFTGLPDRQRSSYFNKQKVLFEDFANLTEQAYAQMPELAGRLYDHCLFIKGLLFNTSERVKRSVQDSGDPVLKADFDKWQQARIQMAKVMTMPLPKNGHSQMDSLENVLMSLEQNLTLRSKAFSDLIEHQLPSWTDIRAALKPGEAAVEIFRYRQSSSDFSDTIHYAALVLTSDTKDHPVFVLLPNGNDLEGNFYQAYRATVTDTSFAPPPYAYQQYWAPIIPYLRGIKTIYFAPDGIYHNLSLPTFINDSGQYLLDLYDLRVLGSTKALLKKNTPVTAPRTGMIFGNPDFRLTPVQNREKIPIPADSPAFYLRNLGEKIKWALEPLPNSQKEARE
ncbi:MAG: tetratricopeptide repeat protein, partial [Saprospiraceae bacterium]|nr:tetratricopeptide repeat protein [Saprospiraceae bacterium]